MKSKFVLQKLITVFVAYSICLNLAYAQTKYKAQKIYETSDIIWAIEFLDAKNIIYNLKGGKVGILNLESQKTVTLTGGPKSEVRGQGGLLDVMLHPDYEKNKMLFFSYTKKVGDNFTTAVAVGKLNGNIIEGLKDIFVANNASKQGHHFGSRLVHDGQGYLFFTVGDRGERDLAQDLSADQGKVHRILLDGSIPADNPFVKNKKASPSVWSYGHRNPQGLKYDFKTQTLYEQEHGPRGGDEINIVLKGKNYGWPKATYGKEYSGFKITDTPTLPDVESPLYYYVPSIAPSGLELVRDGKVPGLEGKLISGALILTHLNVLDISDSKKIKELRLFKSLKERVRDVKQGPDGFLYFSTDSGRIYKVTQK